MNDIAQKGVSYVTSEEETLTFHLLKNTFDH